MLGTGKTLFLGVLALSMVLAVSAQGDEKLDLDPKKLAEKYGVSESDVMEAMNEENERMQHDGTFDQFTPEGLDKNLSEFNDMVEEKVKLSMG